MTLPREALFPVLTAYTVIVFCFGFLKGWFDRSKWKPPTPPSRSGDLR